MTTSAERMRHMRQRRAESLQPAKVAPLRDAGELLGPAVREALDALDLKPEDAAAARLVERYAAVLDTARDPAYAARWIGPLMLAALESVGGTPMARAKLRPVKNGKQPPSRLDLLRQARTTTPGGMP